LPEAALADVLRYRNATARFDLLLRAKALDKLVGLFAQHGVPINQPGGAPHAPPLPLPSHPYSMLPIPLSQHQQHQQHLLPLPPLPPLASALLQPPLPPSESEHLLQPQQPPPPQPPTPAQQLSRGIKQEGEGEGERGPRSSAGMVESFSAVESFGPSSGDVNQQLQSMLGALTLDPPTG